MSKLRQHCLVLLVIVLFGSGCSSFDYYSQAISGHFDVIDREVDIDEVLEDPELDDNLRHKLQLAKKARHFASQNLGLPENDSYTTYADLERPFATWNVVATPEFSLKAKQHCFLFVGCISYRGYFAKQDAQVFEAQLKKQGFDTMITGAIAYSTLGWFDDPVLNTMIRYDDATFIGVIFHELAHQKIYADDDTAFNEAFATVVEYEGVRRWYEQLGDETAYDRYILKKNRRISFNKLLLKKRKQLDDLYKQDISVEQKRHEKQRLIDELTLEYEQWKQQHGDYSGYDKWMSQPLNNAHFALIATYHNLVPALMALLEEVDFDLEQFYAVCERLAEMDKQQRHEILLSY